jgi:hypothetical protein
VRPDLRLLLGGCHHLYDLKVVRFIKPYYTRARVLRADPDTVAAAVQYHADLVNTEYQAAVRKLDAQSHSHIADPEERPLTRRLSSFPPVQGLVFGQFGGASKAVHDLLTETAQSATYKCWRQAGAASPEAAVSGFVSKYRRRWGSVARLGMARLKLARAEMARPVHSTLGPRQRVTDFNPLSHVDFGDATHPVVGGGTHHRRATRGGLPSADIGG